MMANDFYRTVESAHASKVNDVAREPAIRLYCKTFKQQWALQVRSAMQLNNTREGKDFIVASATLTIDDLKALRAAIDEALSSK